MFQMLHQMCTFNTVTTNLKKKMKNKNSFMPAMFIIICNLDFKVIQELLVLYIFITLKKQL